MYSCQHVNFYSCFWLFLVKKICLNCLKHRNNDKTLEDTQFSLKKAQIEHIQTYVDMFHLYVLKPILLEYNIDLDVYILVFWKDVCYCKNKLMTFLDINNEIH